jgi:hypothetical protein
MLLSRGPHNTQGEPRHRQEPPLVVAVVERHPLQGGALQYLGVAAVFVRDR